MGYRCQPKNACAAASPAACLVIETCAADAKALRASASLQAPQWGLPVAL